MPVEQVVGSLDIGETVDEIAYNHDLDPAQSQTGLEEMVHAVHSAHSGSFTQLEPDSRPSSRRSLGIADESGED
jgi:hypothetical protein